MPYPPVPAAVVRLAAGRPLHLLWRNQAGGLTYAVGGPGGPTVRPGFPPELGSGLGAAELGAECVVKWAPAGAPLDLAGERDRLDWASPYSPVPRPLGSGADEAGSWLGHCGRARQ